VVHRLIVVLRQRQAEWKNASADTRDLCRQRFLTGLTALHYLLPNPPASPRR
jgi:hypothetical protein